VGDAQRPGTGPATGPTQLDERAAVADAPRQADSLWRPFSRRERRTARPPRGDMRCREPWRLARRRVVGWDVRLTVFLLDHEASWPPADGASRAGSGAATHSGERLGRPASAAATNGSPVVASRQARGWPVPGATGHRRPTLPCTAGQGGASV